MAASFRSGFRISTNVDFSKDLAWIAHEQNSIAYWRYINGTIHEYTIDSFGLFVGLGLSFEHIGCGHRSTRWKP